MNAELERAAAFFAARQVDEGMTLLGGLIEATAADAPARDRLLAWVIAHVDDDHPQVAAHIALAGGALVENGASPVALGRAIVAPVVRALTDAARMFALAQELGHHHAPDEHEDDLDDDDDEHDDHDEHDHDHDDEHEHEHALEVGGWALGDEQLQAAARKDLAAVQAWFSLEMWYRPAVACWSRDRALLREVQGHADLRAALARIGRDTDTSVWLSILLETLVAAPVVVLVPNLDEAWSMTMDGVVDIGQLTVLASKALADPIRRLDASGVATDEELAVMSGEGPQSGGGAYGSTFAFYPVEACDPDDGCPRDGIHMWSAPGGTGTHSLPGDFLPGTLPVEDGARLLVMVGPHSAGMRFTRVIQPARAFEALTARITDVAKLPEARTRALFALAKQRGRAARSSAP